MKIYNAACWVFFACIFCSLKALQGQTASDTLTYSLQDTTQANQLFQKMLLLVQQQKLDSAELFGQKAQKIYSEILGEKALETVRISSHLGLINYQKGSYILAQQYYERFIENAKPLLGEKSLEMSNAYYNLGNIFYQLMNGKKSYENHKHALDIRIAILGEEHTLIVSSYNAIGNAAFIQNDYERAIDFQKKALRVGRRLFGEGHLEIANSYNNLGISFMEYSNIDSAIFFLRKGLEIRKQLLGTEHSDVGQSLGNLGLAFHVKSEYNLAVENHKASLNILIKKLGVDHPYIAMGCVNIAVSLNVKGDYNQALRYYKSALQIWQTRLGNDYAENAKPYLHMAMIFMQKGEYEKSRLYLQLVANVLQKNYDENHQLFAALYNGLGLLHYFEQEEPQKAIDYQLKAIEIMKKTLPEDHPGLLPLYSDLSIAYQLQEEYPKALEIQEKAIEMTKEAYGVDHFLLTLLYLNAGNSLVKLTKYDSAITKYKMALNLAIGSLGKVHATISQIYNNLGDLFFFQTKYDSALINYKKAINACNYKYKDFQSTNSMLQLIKSLHFISFIYKEKYIIEKNLDFLDSSLLFIQRAISAIDYQISNFTLESSKISWQSENYSTYAQAIDISLLAADINQNDSLRRQTFTYAEKSKATQLQAQLKNADALAYSGIPDSLTQKEYQLRVDLSWREKQRQGLLDQGKSETDSTVLRLSSLLFDLRQQYDTLKSRFEKNYPDYYRLKYDLRTVPLNYVQDTLLQPGQSLLEYFVGDSSIYLFLVQPKNYEVIEIKKDTAFEQWVEDLTRNGIYGFYGKKGVSKGKSINNYGTSAYKLYETLIAPVKAKLPKDEKLIIIPDGILGYVPFEALLTEKPPRPDAIPAYKYLIQDHQISYCYSATLLKEMRNKKHRQEPSQKLLAMAPFFLGNADTLLSQVDSTELMAGITLRDTLTALPNSGEEVARIQKILKGQAFYGKAATMAQFQKLAAQARILHLSTHGKADDRLGDYAYLAFGMPNAQGTFEKLYARDLYNLSLNADLVVLSACETGIGKLQRGEGIVSLARAFAYAGAKSIVTTLWKVSDEQSKNLMTSFYKYLRQGKEKDEALRLAKLDFLKVNEKRTELLHPFFWASFIGIGDMERIK